MGGALSPLSKYRVTSNICELALNFAGTDHRVLGRVFTGPGWCSPEGVLSIKNLGLSAVMHED